MPHGAFPVHEAARTATTVIEQPPNHGDLTLHDALPSDARCRRREDARPRRGLTDPSRGKGISRQAFALVPKIVEVDAFIRDDRIREVHPEVSFRLLARGQPLPPKKTWAGLHARIRLLRSAAIELPEDLGDAALAGTDDVLDAAAAAWSARRIARGEARCFSGEEEQRDRSGRVIGIWG